VKNEAEVAAISKSGEKQNTKNNQKLWRKGVFKILFLEGKGKTRG